MTECCTVFLQEQTSTAGSSPLSPGRPLDVPKELWLLVDKLQRDGVTCGDLFEQPGLHSEVQQIRDALDTGRAHLRILSRLVLIHVCKD